MIEHAPFPDLYDWTWGEALEYIKCREEGRKNDLRVEASMLFHTAGALSNMVAGTKGKRISIMDTYSFLWSKEDRRKAKEEKRHNSLLKKAKHKPLSEDEQSDMLHKLKMKMLAERE